MKKMLLSIGIMLAAAALLVMAASSLRSEKKFIKELGFPDAKVEYQKLAEQFSGKGTTQSIQGTIRLYDGENAAAFKEEMHFSMFRKNQQFYTQLGHVESIYNGSILLQLDTLNQYLLVYKVNDSIYNESSKVMFPYEGMLSDTAYHKTSVSVIEKNQSRVLTVKSELKPEIREVRIVYDTTDYMIRQAEIEWWKSGMSSQDSTRIWLTNISYVHSKTRQINIQNMFDRICTINKTTIIPSEKYKLYKVYNKL